MSSLTISKIDRAVARLLFVRPKSAETETSPTTATHAMRASLFFSGTRCIFQYIILPFVFPLIGVATNATIPLLLAVNVLAVISVVFSLRRFWQVEYTYRGHYLAVAVVIFALLGLFTILDLRVLIL
ncbi:MAG: hypothetical protein AAFV93_13230 [Chloroflexota bacterium]